jgi:predicted nuclease of restriction endonuclease-like (RecB) superfamily
MMGLKFAQMQQQKLAQLPKADSHGRYALLNHYGKTDPIQNAFTLRFVDWADKQTQSWEQKVKESPKSRINLPEPFFLEIGAGFGFLGSLLLQKRVYYFYNDKDRRHFKIATDQVFPTQGLRDSPFLEAIGTFPGRHVVDTIKKSKRKIAGIASFMVLHFLRAHQISHFLDKCWDILERGGQLWLTAGTPYNKLFKNFPTEIYPQLKSEFLQDPSKPFPGEIEDVHTLEYLNVSYPKFFHALDGDILKMLAGKNPKKPWKILEVSNIQRPHPPEQAFTEGYADGKTELVGIILQKE